MKPKTKQGKTKKPDYVRPLALVATAIVIALVLTSLLLYLQAAKPRQPKAAIIDQLSSSQLSATSRFPNPTFIETARALLYKRFPKVEYYSDNATVDQYKYLPSLGYGLIIWRVHSALNLENHFVAICSSERYDPEKYQQYSSDQLTLCNITSDTQLYFATTPKFIQECMNGRFEDTVIIFMSCNGLKERYHKTAEAFIEKGVKAFISWDGWIPPSDNDHATGLLLHYLINENNTIRDAVEKVPKYSYMNVPCELDYYPHTPEAAEFRIPEYNQDKITYQIRLVPAASIRKGLKASRCSLTKHISQTRCGEARFSILLQQATIS